MKRSAGILLPIFSLPSEYGIGSLGAEARAFANFLQDAGQSWWQILPVGPAGAGDSPYASESTFAGNPLFIDLDLLAKDGLLTEEELASVRVPAGSAIDYGALKQNRDPLLRAAFSRVSGEAAEAARREMESARLAIDQARKEAELQFRNEVGKVSIDIAEKMVRTRMQNDKAQTELVNRLLDEIEKN